MSGARLLRFVDACSDEHFSAMSLIHALGWRDTYADAVPADFMAQEITDDRWVGVFRQNYEEGVYQGLLLYRGDTPVSCINFGPARVSNYNPAQVCVFDNSGYEGWGEITSFYSHPDHRGRGYGHLLMEAALDRLKAAGYKNAFVFVLRENEKARRFYAAHGFAWDGTHTDILFPHNMICVDLRYTIDLTKNAAAE